MSTIQQNQNKVDIFDEEINPPKNIKKKLNGQEEVDPTTATERLKICNDCPDLRQPWHQCTHCQCWMPLKARLPFMKCPIGKW
jgi:hypothetical protein